MTGCTETANGNNNNGKGSDNPVGEHDQNQTRVVIQAEDVTHQHTQAKPSRALSWPQYTNAPRLLFGYSLSSDSMIEPNIDTYLQFSPPPSSDVIAAAPAVQNSHVKNKLHHATSQPTKY